MSTAANSSAYSQLAMNCQFGTTQLLPGGFTRQRSCPRRSALSTVPASLRPNLYYHAYTYTHTPRARGVGEKVKLATKIGCGHSRAIFLVEFPTILPACPYSLRGFWSSSLLARLLRVPFLRTVLPPDAVDIVRSLELVWHAWASAGGISARSHE